MANWNSPALSNLIVHDIPSIRNILIALAKLDPSVIDGPLPSMVRLEETSVGVYQFQKYSGSAWEPLTRIQVDAHDLQGYVPSIEKAIHTLVVRNQRGNIQSDLEGNAETATSAASLSEVNPVAMGGTGASTSAQARQNLGVAPIMHASPDTSYGMASADQYGHVKLSDATNGLSTADGGIAATPSAVKVVGDKAGEALQKASDALQKASDAVSRVPDLATKERAGIVQIGDNVLVTEGLISVPSATPDVFGVVKTSETSRAGAVPLMGESGKISEAVLPPLSSLTVGTIVTGMWSSAPTGYVIANGQLCLFADYPELLAAYNAGFLKIGGDFGFRLNGDTGLYVPNLSGQFLQSVTSGAGGKNSAGLPNITGEWSVHDRAGILGDPGGLVSGCYKYGRHFNQARHEAGYNSWGVAFDASGSNATYGKSSTVMPASAKVLACIYVGQSA